MKPLFSFCFAALIGTGLQAQPTLTNSVFIKNGAQIASQEAVSTGITPGSAGANQTWDFSGLKKVDTINVSLSVVRNAAGTSNAADFPLANLAAYTPFDTSEAYTYFQATNTEMLFWGIAATGVVFLNYTDPETLIKAPLSYNGQYTDTYASESEPLPGFTLYGQGSIQATYDGYGTLKIPGQTFTNAMRVKSVQTRNDSIGYFGGASVTRINIEEYSWYVNGKPGPVLTYSTSNGFSITIFPGIPSDTTFLDEEVSITYQVDPSTKTLDRPAAAFGLELAGVSPNPASDLLQVRFSQGSARKPLRLTVYDAQGRALLNRSLEADAAPGILTLPVSNLATGSYILTLTDGERAQSVQWQKQ